MKKFIKPIIFILVLGILWTGYASVFSFKTKDGIYQMKKFYREKDNSIDVLFLGSSRMFVNANTSVLWDEYGIAGYDLGGSIQTYWNTYYYLKEAYKTQSPKLVVFDIYTANQYTKDYAPHQNIIKNVFGMKLSRNKIDAINASAPQEDRATYYSEYPAYHKRYDDITIKDFLYDYENDYFDYNCWKGETLFMEADAIGRPSDEEVYNSEVGKLSAKNEEYLRKIIDLAHENGSEILLVLNPCYVMPGDMPILNRVAELAKQWNVPFINFNYLYDEIGMDFDTDFSDAAHMTFWGSAKFTRYLAGIIKDNYDIPDRRGQAGYESYDTMVSYYKRVEDMHCVNVSEDINSFADSVAGKDYMVAVSVVGNYKAADNYDNVRDALKKLSIDIDSVGGNSAFILDNGNPVFASGNNDEYFWRGKISKYETMSVKSVKKVNDDGTYERILPDLKINSEHLFELEHGVQILVYDKTLKTVVDNVYFEMPDDSIDTSVKRLGQ